MLRTGKTLVVLENPPLKAPAAKTSRIGVPRAQKGRRFDLVDVVDAQADKLVDGQVFHARDFKPEMVSETP